jgi:hypothetical protein
MTSWLDLVDQTASQARREKERIKKGGKKDPLKAK